MISRNELLFTESFISALGYLNVERIPVANSQFKNGVEKLREFLEHKLNEVGATETFEEIKILFSKRPISGDFERIKQAIIYNNGSTIGFILENPKWEKAHIKVSRILADKILSEETSGISKEVMLEATRKFCDGAGIKLS